MIKHSTKSAIEDPPPSKRPPKRRSTIAGKSAMSQVSPLWSEKATAIALTTADVAVEPALLGNDASLVSIGIFSLLINKI